MNKYCATCNSIQPFDKKCVHCLGKLQLFSPPFIVGQIEVCTGWEASGKHRESI